MAGKELARGQTIDALCEALHSRPVPAVEMIFFVFLLTHSLRWLEKNPSTLQLLMIFGIVVCECVWSRGSVMSKKVYSRGIW